VEAAKWRKDGGFVLLNLGLVACESDVRHFVRKSCPFFGFGYQSGFNCHFLHGSVIEEFPASLSSSEHCLCLKT
jgi:hypothetical protein